MTSFKLTKNGKERIGTMVRTNDGFEIAEADLKLRVLGILKVPSRVIIEFRLANLVKDGEIVSMARAYAAALLKHDPSLQMPEHQRLSQLMQRMDIEFKEWSKVS